MKFKTLKDFDSRIRKCEDNCNCLCHSHSGTGCDDCNEDNLLFDDLKQEAIKIYKQIEKARTHEEFEEIFGEGMIGDNVAEPAAIIMFIEKFFNITEEDLEVVDESPQDYKEQLKDIGEQAIKEDIEAKADLKKKYKDD